MKKITTTTEYAQALHLALQESKTEDYDTIVENLIAVMRDNGDLGIYEAVVEEYEQLAKANSEKTQVEAVFGREASSNKKVLDELNNVLGPSIEIRSKVDQELVGGMVLRVDDTLIDASVKGGLERLKDELSE